MSLPSEPFAANLTVVWMFDSERGMQLLTSTDLDTLKLTQEQIAAAALQNLETQVGPIPFKLLDDEIPGLYVIDSSDSYEASRLLLPQLWQPLVKKVAGAVTVMAPCRNIVLAVGADDAKAMAAMKEIGTQMFQTEPYALSSSRFQLGNAGWKVLP